MKALFATAILLVQVTNPVAGRGPLVISGNVKDSTGLPMAATTVWLRRDQSLPRLTATDNNGHFVFPGLWPGKYEVVMEAPDFMTETRPLDLVADVDFDVLLKVKSIGTCPGPDCIGVTAVLPLVDSRTEAAKARRWSAERLASELWEFSMQMDLAKSGSMDPRRSAILKRFHELETDALPALILALQDPDILMRRNAALILLDLSGGYSTSLLHTVDIREALPALISELQDSDSLACGWSAQAIGNIGPPAASAVPALTKLLKDGDEGGRNSSCIALGKIGAASRSAPPALRNALNDPSNEVRGFARFAIDSIEKN